MESRKYPEKFMASGDLLCSTTALKAINVVAAEPLRPNYLSNLS
jgi:hypothetical protein